MFGSTYALLINLFSSDMVQITYGNDPKTLRRNQAGTIFEEAEEASLPSYL
jgi:hypothetical protein